MRQYFVFYAMLTLVVLASVDKPQAPAQQDENSYTDLFNHKDLTGWNVYNGKEDIWKIESGNLVCNGKDGGWLMTDKQYSNFTLGVSYRITEGANSGVALRSPLKGNPAYEGMEIQILDDATYKKKGELKPVQMNGAVFDVLAPKEDAAKPVGEWNTLTITVRDDVLLVNLNKKIIQHVKLNPSEDVATKHPGLLRKKGHIGLQSYAGRVEFSNVVLTGKFE